MVEVRVKITQSPEKNFKEKEIIIIIHFKMYFKQNDIFYTTNERFYRSSPKPLSSPLFHNKGKTKI
jgi:hypothetical protein